MQVMHGWSGETSSGSWAKYEVVGDENDLHRILADEEMGGIDLTEREAFGLLDCVTEIFATMESIKYLPAQADAARQKAAGLMARRDVIVSKIRERALAAHDYAPAS